HESGRDLVGTVVTVVVVGDPIAAGLVGTVDEGCDPAGVDGEPWVTVVDGTGLDAAATKSGRNGRMFPKWSGDRSRPASFGSGASGPVPGTASAVPTTRTCATPVATMSATTAAAKRRLEPDFTLE